MRARDQGISPDEAFFRLGAHHLCSSDPNPVLSADPFTPRLDHDEAWSTSPQWTTITAGASGQEVHALTTSSRKLPGGGGGGGQWEAGSISVSTE